MSKLVGSLRALADPYNPNSMAGPAEANSEIQLDRFRTIVAIADTSPLGRAVLRHAFSRFEVEAVLFPTAEMFKRFRQVPDRPRWRRVLSAIKSRILRPEQEPLEDRGMGERLSWDEIVERWPPGTFDLFLSAGFPAILPDGVLAIADRQVNVHTSLLPQLKGRHPHYWAVAWGLERSGLTAHEMTGELDSGAIVGQFAVDIPRGTTYHQHYRELRRVVPNVLDQVHRWLATGERVTPIDVAESWSPGEPPT